MISTRKKNPSEYFEVLVFWDLAKHQVQLEHKISEDELKLLMIVHYIQLKCNINVPFAEFVKLFRGDLSNIQRHIDRLVDAGLVDDTKFGLNITVRGEYVMRGVNTMLNRQITGSMLPKWSRLKKNDSRREFLRKATQESKQYKP